MKRPAHRPDHTRAMHRALAAVYVITGAAITTVVLTQFLTLATVAALVGVVVSLILLIAALARSRRVPEHLCSCCRYPIECLGGSVCPECGWDRARPFPWRRRLIRSTLLRVSCIFLVLSIGMLSGGYVVRGDVLRVLPFGTLLRVEPLYRVQVWREVARRCQSGKHLGDDEIDRLLYTAGKALDRAPDCSAGAAAIEWAITYMNENRAAFELVIRSVQHPCVGVRERAAAILTSGFPRNSVDPAIYAAIVRDKLLRPGVRRGALAELTNTTEGSDLVTAALREVAARGDADELAADAAQLLRDRESH